MAKWRVYNVHSHGLTHEENFRGDKVVIPVGGYVLMDYEDAVQFKGQYFPIKKNGDGVQLPESYKMIEIRPDTDADAPVTKQKYVCQMDGREFESATALEAYTKAMYGDQVVTDEVAEAEIKKGKRKTG